MTPRRRLVVAWERLQARGAVVRRVRLEGLTAHELNALAFEAERRLAVIAEGREHGWVPLKEAS